MAARPWKTRTRRALGGKRHPAAAATTTCCGGREGFETLLYTNLKQEIQQFGHFLTLVVENKHKIGFDGQISIEPKPKEPSAHQPDFAVATLYG